jgi:3-(3-hydroxy-phenyl)propionate hydroxylase
LWLNHTERILADWVDQLGVPVHRGVEGTGVVADDTGVDVASADGRTVRLVSAEPGRDRG